jgi:hypothetical protein
MRILKERKMMRVRRTRNKKSIQCFGWKTWKEEKSWTTELDRMKILKWTVNKWHWRE